MNKQSGSSLIEILVSLSIFSLIILGTEFILLKSQRYHQEAFTKTQQLLNDPVKDVKP